MSVYNMSSRTYSTQLQSFLESTKDFQILNPTSRSSKNDTLYILDSSFNPPTKAHLGLALSSLTPDTPSTVLLLLAIQNADKSAKPATFDHRLEMMQLLAKRIERTSSSTTALIALSKHPIFVDKAKEVAMAFPSARHFVWLVGYDTLIRILDKKYYSGTVEESLRAFWEKNRLVCAIRRDEIVERAYVEKIRQGEIDGVPRTWAEYVKIIEPVGKGESSTRAREAAAVGRWEELGVVVPEEIAEYIKAEQLYRE
jgi:nicotinamide-nucleotide adenylyltransferase